MGGRLVGPATRAVSAEVVWPAYRPESRSGVASIPRAIRVSGSRGFGGGRSIGQKTVITYSPGAAPARSAVTNENEPSGPTWAFGRRARKSAPTGWNTTTAPAAGLPW